MDQAAYLRLIRGESRGPVPRLARAGLSSLAPLYGLGIGVRNGLFDLGMRTIHRAAVPVVSIGNITVGGTGKTPMVEWVARWFRRRGLRVAILSRGYGATEGLNDEGRVLEANLPDVPHLQGRDRVELARIAVEELESQILVMDDGFQHRRLARDLDVVLLDALNPFGLDRLLPRGQLREPARSLRRADLVVLSRADLIEPDDRSAIRRAVERRAGDRPWIEARHAPVGFINASGECLELDDPMLRRRAVAFCGIGNPEGFRRSLEGLEIRPVDFRTFPDHFAYGPSDVAGLIAWAGAQRAELALTTQKDSVKLRSHALGPTPLWALKIGLEVLDGQDHLESALGSLLPGGS